MVSAVGTDLRKSWLSLWESWRRSRLRGPLPRPPLTRIMSTELTGGEIVPSFPETVSVSSAPSDEGAGSAADWGRESFVFSGNIWCFQTVFSPSVKNLRFLPPPSSEGGLGFRFSATPVETLIRGRLGFPLSQSLWRIAQGKNIPPGAPGGMFFYRALIKGFPLAAGTWDLPTKRISTITVTT